MLLRKADRKDENILAELALLLWPNHTILSLKEEIGQILCSQEAAFFVAFAGNEPVGFSQCQLRHDYVEGTSSSPMGYLEGIFVKEEFRKKGIAGNLLSACQNWAKEQGCTEFASDCELQNESSLSFHLHHGFLEANRIICFTKPL